MIENALLLQHPSNFYDVNLKDRLQSNNSNDIVLNKNFNKWSEHISNHIQYRDQSQCGKYYSQNIASELLGACINHKNMYKNNNSIETCDTAIMLTHPLYLNLSHMHKLTTDSLKQESDTYLDKLFDLMSIDRLNKFSIVLLDTIHHYAAATSLLLEKKYVDDVIFTEYKNGFALDMDDINPNKEKIIYFAGSYNGRCLRNSIDEFKKIVNDLPLNLPVPVCDDSIYAIKDLVLKYPEKNIDTLIPDSIDGLALDKVVSLEHMLKSIGVAR